MDSKSMFICMEDHVVRRTGKPASYIIGSGGGVDKKKITIILIELGRHLDISEFRNHKASPTVGYVFTFIDGQTISLISYSGVCFNMNVFEKIVAGKQIS